MSAYEEYRSNVNLEAVTEAGADHRGSVVKGYLLSFSIDHYVFYSMNHDLKCLQ